VASTSKLNTRQEELLRRIADGDSPVTSREYVLASTVYALRSRGLVVTPRAAGVWSAVVTDAGRFYLAYGCYPERNAGRARRDPVRRMHRHIANRAYIPAPAPMPVREPPGRIDVVGRVRDAHGMLRVSDPDPAARARWRASIQAAIRDGQPVHYTGRLRGDLVICLPTAADAFGRPAHHDQSADPASRPDGRGDWHPLIADLRERAAALQTAGQNVGLQEVRLPDVPARLLPRALRILHAIVREAERRGHHVRLSVPGDESGPRDVCLLIHGYPCPVTIMVIDGVMTLRLLKAGRGRQHWQDGRRVPLERRIGDVLDGLEARVAQIERHDRDYQQYVAEQQRDLQPLFDQARARYELDYATTILREQVAAWRLAFDVRNMCAAIQRRINDDTTNSAFRTDIHAWTAWIAWAQEHAERLDPLEQPPPIIPTIPEPSPKELNSYLPDFAKESR
jgi:hypothetical protein